MRASKAGTGKVTLLLLIPFVKGAMGTTYCKKCPPEFFADHDFPVVYSSEEKGQGGGTDWDRRSECERGRFVLKPLRAIAV